ncbi:MAG TPA: alpha/beta fold hydrolase [Holophagaceae bacterium]|nr:alpha/beta fold hydrolase [Holophagaceae bacterium]
MDLERFEPSLRPPWWARGPHAQTILGHLLPSPAAAPPWESLTLRLPDGDALKVRLARGRTDTLVYLFHGLGGDADRDYMRRSAALAWRAGHSVMAVNHRGAGEGRGGARRPYHSGATTDAATVIQAGRGFFPGHRHLAIGFSLSGNILLLLLGRDQHLAQPDLVISVNPPVDLDHCSRLMERGLNRIYDFRFVGLLRKHLQEQFEFGLLDAPVRIPALATLRDFDNLYTAPYGGFRDREDYYATCSAGPHLGAIQTPTVILSCKDDPFAPGSDIEACRRSPAVHLHLEARGGHMGYLDAGVPGRRWLDAALQHYMDALLSLAGAEARLA